MTVNKRKGQLSIFLILAAVLIIIAGVTWYIVGRTQSGEPTLSQSTEVQQVEQFVANCLTESSRLALEAAGRNAGYVNPEQLGYTALSVAHTEGRALTAFDGGDPLPYWSHLSSANTCANCQQSSEQPALTGGFPSVQWQLESAITQATVACLDDFSTFTAFQVEPVADPITLVTFSNEEVTVAFDYPLQITSATLSAQPRDRTTVRLDIPFQKLYKIAYDIRLQAQATDFFEGMTLEAITYESADGSIPPPSGGLEISYNPGPLWALVEVKEVIRDLLVRNVNIVQLYGARNMDYVLTGDDLTDNLYANYYFSIAEDAAGVDATFIYLPEWEPYVKVSPGGQIIQPERIASIPLLPQFKRKDFLYDVSYPVLVQLQTDTTSGPFLFEFPIEVNMRRNRPLSTDAYSELAIEEDFCNPENAVGSTVSLQLSEQTTGSRMDAVVRYSCVDQVCYYGETTNGELQTRLPSCIAGELVAEREGYRSARVRFDSVSDELRQVNMPLTKLANVGVQFEAIPLIRPVRVPGADPVPWMMGGSDVFSSEYKVVATFIPIDDPDYAQVYVSPPGEGQPTTIALAPGEYDISVVVLENLAQPHVVQGKEVCGGGVLGIGGSCETIPDITFGDGAELTLDDGTVTNAPAGVMYAGGALYDQSTKRVYITKESLASGSIIVPVPYVTRSELQTVDDLDVYEAFNIFVPQLMVR